MSEQLKRTRRFLEAMCMTPMRNWSGGYNWERANQLEYAVFSLLHHLESQPQTPSESSSSQDTGKPEVTSGGWSTSFESWCRVNLDGTLTLFPPESIWASVSSLFGRGNWPGAVTGVTLTRKAATPPSGSASSSPAEEVSEASGRVGDCQHEWVGLWSTGLTKAECQKCGRITDITPPAPSQSSSNRTEEVSR